MRENEAAGMLAMMSRRADELVGKLEGELQAAVLHIEVQLFHLLFANALAPAPNLR